jgi:hypothetical protein
MAATLDVGDEPASMADNVSAGGTRYIVGLKGGLKFYGQQSAVSRDDGDSASNNSRIEYPDNQSQVRSQTANRVERPKVIMDFDKKSHASINDFDRDDPRAFGDINDDI